MEITLNLTHLITIAVAVVVALAFWKLYSDQQKLRTMLSRTIEEYEGSIQEKVEQRVEEHIENLPPQPVRVVDPEREVYADSPTPWVKWLGVEEDPEKGIEVRLDWNKAFIKKLRAAGYTGVDEQQMIQKYLLMTMQVVAEDMAQQYAVQDPDFDEITVQEDDGESLSGV
jgi:hypothetical protein